MSKTGVALVVANLSAAAGYAAVIPNFDPINCDGAACATTVSGGATLTLTGSGTQIPFGQSGASTTTAGALYAAGKVVVGGQYVNPADPASLKINVGFKSVNLAVPDPIVGGISTMAVYDNANFSDSSLASTQVALNTPVNGNQYIGTRIGGVDATGGTLNVNIGTAGPTDSAANLISMAVKDASLFKADGSGGVNSTIVWQGTNRVQLGDLTTQATPGGTTSTLQTFAYKGSFLAFDGSSHSVNNAADLRAYNSFLIGKLQSGALSPSGYDAAFNFAYTTSYQQVAYLNGPSDLTDEVYAPIGNRAVIEASGAKALGRIDAGARIDAVGVNATGSYVGAVMLANNGGAVVNQGALSTMRGQGVSYAMYAASNSTASNQGVVNLGYLAGSTGNVNPRTPVVNSSLDYGMRAAGSASAISNAANGIINIGGPGAVGMIVDSGNAGTNAGILNVGVGEISDSTSSAGTATTGVKTAGTFTNAVGSTIYLGRGPQYNQSAPEAASDVRSNGTSLVGVNVTGTGTLNNAGTITIGSLTQGSKGIFVNLGTGSVTNAATGIINVNGRASAIPLENDAILATDAANVSNAGVINLNGVNSVGLKVNTSVPTRTSQGTNSGIINVAGGADPASGTRNYGIWSEGVGATAALSNGEVNLAGDGAIGVHARNSGKINVTGGSVNFVSGKKQIGFFAYGSGAMVNINSAPVTGLNVSTQGSTLFRIEDGAKINNNAGAPLIASGKDSTVLQVTGVGSSANLDSLNILLSGQGATAIKVEGGATGQMSGAAALTLSDGATIAVVDNTKYDLSGNAIATALSTFTNSAPINVLTAQNVTAFVVKNGAKLINAGNIHLSDGTGIEVQGAGSSIEANGSGVRGTITVDDGVAGIYTHAGAQLTINDTITVNNGAAGVLIGADAGKITVGPATHITGLGGSYGTLVLNRAAAGSALVDGATLEMQGSGSALLSTSNLDAASHGHIIVSSNVGGKGVSLSREDGGLSNGSLALGAGWNIDVSGNGSGVYANTTGDLSLAGTQMSITGSQAATGVRIDSANNVTIGAGTVLQTGNANATLVAGNPRVLTNAGTLTAASVNAKAVALDDSGHAFVNDSTGAITGLVALGNGTNTALLKSGSVLNGTLAGGTGQDTFTVRNNAGFTSVDGGVGVGDKLIFDAANYTYNDPNAILRFETVQLSNNSTLTLKQALMASDTGTDTNTVAVDAGSTLAVAPATGSFMLNNRVQGAGTVTTNTTGNAFAFGAGNAAATGTSFTGTLALGASTFLLGGDNTAALKNATLQAGAGSVTSVADGVQQIGGLKFSGGTVVFNASLPDSTVAASTIKTAVLDASGTGNVRITVPAPYVPSAPGTPNTANLLTQDDGNIGVKLVAATTTVGSGGALVLQDQTGNAISAAKSVDIAQGGGTVATGTYDFGVTTAPGDGLYVNYGLKQLALQNGKTLMLAQDAGATGAAADMSAKIIGSGNLAINAGSGIVSLSNTTNSYTGDTSVVAGTLRLDANGAMGATDVLHLANASALDVNGKTQAIGSLDGQSGSVLDVHGGSLTILAGGASAGSLTGAGSLNLAGGTLAVNGGNAGLSTTTSILSGAAAVLDHVAGLGSGAIAAAGSLELKGAAGTLVNAISGAGDVVLSNAAQVKASGDNTNFSGTFKTNSATVLTVERAANLGTAAVANGGALVVDTASDWTLGNAVSGTGDVLKRGAGVLTAGNGLTYTGSTFVQAGTLVVGDPANLGATLGGAGAGAVNVFAGATLGGAGMVNGNVVNNGTVSALNAMAGMSAQPASTFTLANGLVNNGNVNLAGGSIGNALAVKGGYTGNGGTLTLNTYMGGDSSATDKLVVDGGQATGDTGLVIKHAGGSGAQTVQGIRLVETRNGAGTTADAFRLDARSDGYRQGVGTIAAGAYDYRLARGGNGGNVQDWYLVSKTEDAPVPPVPPTPPGPAPDPDPGTPVQPVTPSYRPEVGAYLNNQLAATTMQYHTLRDRQGQAPNAIGGEGAPDASSWLRISGGQDSRNGVGSIKDRSNSNLIHGGSDVLRLNVGKEGSLRMGAMASYGTSSSTARSSGLEAGGKVEGYNVGVYGTWYGHQDMISGPYVDTWAMLGRYDNSVNGQGLEKEKYRSRAATTSVESGYSFKIYENGARQLYIQPQAQAILSNYRADDHTENTGTKVTGQSQTSVTTRVGVRLQGNIDDDHGMSKMRPFAEVNWWNGPSSQRASFDGEVVREQLPANRVELKAGVQGNVTKAVSLYGSLGLEAGSNNYTGARGQIGVKYSW
ncbi:hypothetical protein A9973_13875 [Achromobacter sp. UMC46]|nr:hypothetical protein [Achromobacter sp. UMC46]